MKMLRLLISCILIVLGQPIWTGATEICDMGAAKEWCDNAMLDILEGIWEYPDDHTTVLIRRNHADNSEYDIIVVASPDTRIKAGDIIGYMKKSPDPTQYEMGVYKTKNKQGVLKELGKCLARLNEKNDALTVKGRSVKFSLGSRYLLPSFWRLLRITVKDPLENLPEGLVRIYPDAKRRQPDYL